MDTRDKSGLTEDSDPISLEEIKQLKTALDESRQKSAENWDLFLRARADSENIQRRAAVDIENAHKYGMEKLANELLLVVDSLEQGLSAAEKSVDAGLKEGMVLTQKLLLNALDKFGIKMMDPKGKAFDPAKHEALSTQASEDAPNQVLLVIQKGFTLHDRVLRPARVIVSREKNGDDSSQGD